ncbi:MAG: lytic transglycosylase domain-containing protein [Gorillibacterium sp.]|nr:lytic transglycosylase domain-containing protein [Gorillibacterium sp.]
MKVLRKKRVSALLFLAIILILFYNNTWISRFIYPIQYRTEIEEAAKANDLDPLFVAAIIRVESNYQANSKSRKGAVGIMQIMPDTASWLLTKDDDLKNDRAKDLNDPEVNIRIGTRYLQYLNKRFEDNNVVIAASYNAGHGKVSGWLKDKIWDGTLENADQIPIMETRKYVKSVDYYYAKYSKVYR